MKPTEGDAHFAVGEVWEHCSAEGIALTIVSMWEYLSYDSGKCCLYSRQSDKPELVSTDDILCLATWSAQHNRIRILVPYHLRP